MKENHINYCTNKVRYGTNTGIFIHLQMIKTVADFQDSCKMSKQYQTDKKVADSQDNCRL